MSPPYCGWLGVFGGCLGPFGRDVMPKGPKGEKRSADVIGGAVHVMRIATGQIEDAASQPRNAAAELGSRGGKARWRPC